MRIRKRRTLPLTASMMVLLATQGCGGGSNGNGSGDVTSVTTGTMAPTDSKAQGFAIDNAASTTPAEAAPLLGSTSVQPGLDANPAGLA